ncbi:glycoside hydrolase [Reticulibacter mediterranei]|uniref:Glycoside hydrolase n=1 Tax=Reticulibacter mediterranei TaxID=2778369 RepID=A0A8J3N1Z7_9CHLR|nr:glycosyltransferase family 4 protein [Reticulibacter mediterranei]GHO95664.1 glycoside hydrolase [Reticulibacter mediterranei]
MRILMIAPEPFLEPRGTPFSVYHRIKALTSLGYEVDLVTYPIGEGVSLSGLRVFRAPALPFIQKVKIGPSLAKLPLDLLVFFTAWKRMSQERYQYVHTHEEAGLMGALLTRIFRCKHLYDMHSDLSQQMSNFAFTKNPLLIRTMEAVQKFIIQQADTVIAICRDLEQTVRRLAPDKPVYLIENVAVDEALPPASKQEVMQLREQLALSNNRVLLYTGTFESYQGIELLLKSVALVHAECLDARYVLVGGRPDQVAKQEQLARELGISEQVRFVGQRPLDEMPAYMALADILVSPRSEGTNTPLKLYTYLRSGKPVLATKIFSHTQMLTDDTAMLVSPTPEDLARGALELLSYPWQAELLARNAREMAAERYSWKAFLKKNEHAYNTFTGLENELSA